MYAYLSERGEALGLGSSFKHAVVDEALASEDLNILVGKWVDHMKSVIASYHGKVTGYSLTSVTHHTSMSRIPTTLT